MTTLTNYDVFMEVYRAHGMVVAFDWMREYPPAMPITVWRDDAEEVPRPDVKFDMIWNGGRLVAIDEYREV